MWWEIIVPEAEVVDSESVRSGNVLEQPVHPGPQLHPQGISISGSETNREREKDSWNRLSPLACAAICRLASAPLPWAQWLSGKSV